MSFVLCFEIGAFPAKYFRAADRDLRSVHGQATIRLGSAKLFLFDPFFLTECSVIGYLNMLHILDAKDSEVDQCAYELSLASEGKTLVM